VPETPGPQHYPYYAEKVSAVELVVCPECGAPAEIQSRSELDSTSGPLAHVKIWCVNGHWFLLPEDSLVQESPELPFRVSGRE
jgi:hypothetical protein